MGDFHCVVMKNDKVVYCPYSQPCFSSKETLNSRRQLFVPYPKMVQVIFRKYCEKVKGIRPLYGDCVFKCKDYVKANGGELTVGGYGVVFDGEMDWIWGNPHIKTWGDFRTMAVDSNRLTTPIPTNYKRVRKIE